MRKYLPTFAELIDRLSIVTLKSIKLSENKEEYEKEAQLIMNDIDEICRDWMIDNPGQAIRAILMIMFANNTIWINESEARKGGTKQDHLLKFTHSINGIRNDAKNVISNLMGERVDLKTDCIAAEICKTQGYDCGSVL